MRTLKWQVKKLKFPSPYGELHFSIVTTYWLSADLSFPSPYGELHFSMQIRNITKKSDSCFRPLTGNYISQWNNAIHWIPSVLVSVPLRGTTFLNRAWVYQKQISRVSVPLRGTTFLNLKVVMNNGLVVERFPSPYGELHFSIRHGSCIEKVGSCFRPLTGNYISQ